MRNIFPGVFAALLAVLPSVAVAPPQAAPPQPAPLSDRANGDYGGYFTWPEIQSKIAQWKRDYPALIHESVLGTTYEGRPIPLLRLSDDAESNTKEPEILVMGGIHPREQQPQVCLLRLVDEILAGYGKDARMTRLLKDRQIWFIPVLNVDGKVYDMQHGDGKTKGADWRKNRHPNADGTIGTDLNRNFGVRWGGSRILDPLWKTTTDNPKGDIYEGGGPLSEPETQALAAFMASRKNLRAFLDVHSPLEVILYPPYCIAEDNARFERIVSGMRALQQQPYEVKKTFPDGEPPLNARGGNSGLTYTWAYYTQGVYGFNFEIAPGKRGQRGNAARYTPYADILKEYKANVREPLLYFLENASELPPALSGSLRCDGEPVLPAAPVPGAIVTWTPPPIAGDGSCDWAVLVSEGAGVLIDSEYRKVPIRNGFTIEVTTDARPGDRVPLTLYLWDRNRHGSVAHFTLTVAEK